MSAFEGAPEHSIFLGFSGIGGPEILVLFFIVGIPVAIAFIVLAVVRASQQSGKRPPLPGERTTESRLKELEALRQSGAVTESEYETKRREILEDL